MIQEYNCYGDGDMVAVKAGRGNWVRYSDHLAEVERAVRIALTPDTTACVDVCEFDDDSRDCLQCDIKRVMEELKK